MQNSVKYCQQNKEKLMCYPFSKFFLKKYTNNRRPLHAHAIFSNICTRNLFKYLYAQFIQQIKFKISIECFFCKTLKFELCFNNKGL